MLRWPIKDINFILVFLSLSTVEKMFSTAEKSHVIESLDTDEPPFLSSLLPLDHMTFLRGGKYNSAE